MSSTLQQNRSLNFQQSGAEEACWAHNPEVGGSKPPSATYTFSTHHEKMKWVNNLIDQDAPRSPIWGRRKCCDVALAHLSFDSDAGSRTLGLAHPKRESYHMTKWSSWPWCFGSLKSETDKARIKNASKIDAHFGMTRWPSG